MHLWSASKSPPAPMHVGARGREFPLTPSNRHFQSENHQVVDDRRVSDGWRSQHREALESTGKMGKENHDNNVARPAGLQEGDFGVLAYHRGKGVGVATISSQTTNVRIEDILKPLKHDVAVVPARLHDTSKLTGILVTRRSPRIL